MSPSRCLSHGTSLRRVPWDKLIYALICSIGTDGTRGTSGTDFSRKVFDRWIIVGTRQIGVYRRRTEATRRQLGEV